jgi:heavy metal translocating P-type ATPase
MRKRNLPEKRQADGRQTSGTFLNPLIALITTAAITVHLVLRFVLSTSPSIYSLPLYLALAIGAVPLVYDLGRKALRAEFGSDLLAGISILAAMALGQLLVGTIVVLMLSGGEALESYATRRASSVLEALAKRMPAVAHRRTDAGWFEISVSQVMVGDVVTIFPHEICPVDGIVIEGEGGMNEAYLTGEPFENAKVPGSLVLSGAINGETALTIRATRKAVDSRYASIMHVMEKVEQERPRIRRIADRLGAWYTPLALGIAVLGWMVSGDPLRFLAVLVIATPCPLLIAIPVAIIGAISLSARRGIIIKNPAVLEQIDACRTFIFDKTGTLTYGTPSLTEIIPADGMARQEALRLAASLEVYSKHPLSRAVIAAAQKAKIEPTKVSKISETPGEGLRGMVDGHEVLLTSRGKVTQKGASPAQLPAAPEAGLEFLEFVDGKFAAAFHLRDEPRKESSRFVGHLKPRHLVNKIMLVSGDRESEVRHLAGVIGITEMHFSKSPEEKVAIVSREANHAPTLFVGDGINDAPAMVAATVGVALGQSSEITANAADAVVLDSSLTKVDELIHISRRMRSVALQSAVGGMAFSLIGMLAAVLGYLPPLSGAVAQEIIDIVAVLNALRVGLPQEKLADFQM